MSKKRTKKPNVAPKKAETSDKPQAQQRALVLTTDGTVVRVAGNTMSVLEALTACGDAHAYFTDIKNRMAQASAAADQAVAAGQSAPVRMAPADEGSEKNPDEPETPTADDSAKPLTGPKLAEPPATEPE